jgi:sugar/nucleoside kinase (ribokinase family)
VNLRRNTKSGLAGYTPEIIAESLKLATIVKMNEVELEEVGELLGSAFSAIDPGDQMQGSMERLCEDFSLDAVAITRGSRGACLYSKGKHVTLPDSTIDQALVHPVGAGDAFAAGLLFGMMEGWTPEQTMQLAEAVSSFVVRQVSATPFLDETAVAEIRELASAAHRTIGSQASQTAAQPRRTIANPPSTQKANDGRRTETPDAEISPGRLRGPGAASLDAGQL